MNPRPRQRGMSATGLMFVLIVLGFAVLVGLKLFPVYLESFKIDNALQALIQEPNLAQQSTREIGESLIRRLDIDDVRRIDYNNYRDYVDIKKQRDKVSITVAYRAETELFGNLSLVANFHKQVETQP